MPLHKEPNKCFTTQAMMMFLMAESITLGCQAKYFNYLELSKSGQDLTTLQFITPNLLSPNHSRISLNFIFHQKAFPASLFYARPSAVRWTRHSYCSCRTWNLRGMKKTAVLININYSLTIDFFWKVLIFPPCSLSRIARGLVLIHNLYFSLLSNKM